MQTHIGCICLVFPRCVFSYASLNYLPWRRQSRTHHTCLAFLHCACSYGFQGYFHWRMKSHTCSMCKASLHCVSSCESSDVLSVVMRRYTGYICWVFHQCVFSNAYLENFYWNRQSHTGYNDEAFLHHVISCEFWDYLDRSMYNRTLCIG